MQRRRHGLKRRSGNAQTSSPRCALRRPAMRSPDDWRRREKLSRAPLSSTPTCALPISRIESGFFATPKITQNMRMRCARLEGVQRRIKKLANKLRKFIAHNSAVHDANLSLNSAITGLLRLVEARRMTDSGSQSASTGIIAKGSTPPTTKIAGQPKTCTNRLAKKPPSGKPIGTPADIRMTSREKALQADRLPALVADLVHRPGDRFSRNFSLTISNVSTAIR